MENAQSVASIRMSNIVCEFTERRVLRANVRIKRRASGVRLGVEPVAVVVSTCSMVSSEDVVWMCDPEASRSLIRVK